jgi:hypothetical protein
VLAWPCVHTHPVRDGGMHLLDVDVEGVVEGGKVVHLLLDREDPLISLISLQRSEGLLLIPRGSRVRAQLRCRCSRLVVDW